MTCRCIYDDARLHRTLARAASDGVTGVRGSAAGSNQKGGGWWDTRAIYSQVIDSVTAVNGISREAISEKPLFGEE